MLAIIALSCLAGALALLLALSVIDLKIRILPNELVMGFMALGLVFHLSIIFAFFSIAQMLLGGLIGGGMLYLLRETARFFYGQDGLGMGDVKLMAAAGLWLGPYYILIALVAGACAGILHGLFIGLYLGYKDGHIPDFGRLSLPAGPGFAIGIVVAGIFAFRGLYGVL